MSHAYKIDVASITTPRTTNATAVESGPDATPVANTSSAVSAADIEKSGKDSKSASGGTSAPDLDPSQLSDTGSNS